MTFSPSKRGSSMSTVRLNGAYFSRAMRSQVSSTASKVSWLWSAKRSRCCRFSTFSQSCSRKSMVGRRDIGSDLQYKLYIRPRGWPPTKNCLCRSEPLLANGSSAKATLSIRPQGRPPTKYKKQRAGSIMPPALVWIRHPRDSASEHFEDAAGTHAAADAHGQGNAAGSPALAFDQGVARQALARHAVGMTHRNGATVDVQAVGRDAQLVAAIQHLHRKGFVEFPQVDVVDRQAQSCQRLGHGKDRADAHFIRLASGHGKAQEATQGLEALFLGQRFVHDHAGTRAIGKLAGIARRDHAARDRGLDAADAFHRGALTQTFVFAHGDLLGDQAQGLVVYACGHGDRCDLVVELAGRCGRAGLLLTGSAILVHAD